MTAFHKSALLSLLLPYSPSSAGTASETIRFLNTDPITVTASTEQEPKICREDVIIGSASCLGNNATMCQEKCALYGTTSLLEKCCMYSGVSGTLLAYDESENWMRRINEFNKCTGANLRIKYQEGGEAAMAQALINDVGVDIHSGNGIYDAYVVRAPWMPPIYRGLRPLSEKIKGSAEYVRFNDINEVTREAVSFDGEIYALPVDSHYIAMGWRQDVFELHADYYQNIYGEELAVPKTIEQLVLVSERLNGLDHNGDGEPDWGFCFTPTTNQFFTFLAPVLQTNMHECDKMLDGSGFDCSHGSNTGQNIFFDVDTFEPLIHNEGFRYVFDLYYRFIKSSNCQDSGDCDHTIDFPTGRCAGVLSLSDMMNTLLLDSIQPRYDNDGNVVWAPGQNLALGQHWGRRAIFPGSNKVVDWKAPGKPLIECTPEKCPLGKDGINYTPFFSQAGEAYAINGKVSKPRSADAMWDMFAWFAELPFADQPHQGLYRKSQLTDEYSVQLEENYNAVMAEDLRAVLEHYFRSQDEGNNPALDSRLRGFDEYDRKLGYELHDKLIFAEVAEGGLFSDDGPSLEAERNSQEYDERYSRFLSNVDAMFYEFNTKSEGGALGNLVLWRNHLNIHPVKSEEEICSELLARNPAVFDKLDCASAVDLEAMCPTQKDYVEAYAPGTCISSSSSDKTITTVIVLCSVLGGAVLVLIFYFGYHRYKKYRKLATEQKQLTETILNDSVRSTKSIDYPFHLIRGDEFVNENKLLRFEVLRNTHRLTVLDTLKDVDAFIDAGKQIVFLSHQWTSFAAPDPSGTQYEAMCLALKELARQSGWDESLKDVFIWVDYCCLPQANTSAQNLTIRSVAAYAASATYFIMVAPETMHADLDEVCDIDTYQERVWTRVEQVCHAMRNGTDGMFITKGKASPLEKVKREFFNESFRMFEGELTCCRLEHKGMALCDRQCLVVPLLGLYGELYRETVVGSKGGSGQCFECVDDFLTEIEKRQDEIFPPTFKRTTWRKNKQSEETIQLFGDLISRMKCRIKNGDGFTIDDDNTTSTMGSDYVRHGATHGIRF